MSTGLVAVHENHAPLPIPWRDPHTVSRESLQNVIMHLEQACLDNPQSADLRTCLGMAHAMNFDVYKSMDALDEARQLEPENFWAQMKYAELHYRLRALLKAEQDTLRALELARTPLEMAVARRQLQEIRRLMREGTQKPAWHKPLIPSAIAALGVSILLCIAALLS
jgi:tetratricopeptide (TPR) repeat protein